MKLFIAHRGARKIITENTLDSILTAFKYGATHAEVDVRKTKDGRLILFHDPVTFRFNRKLLFINKTKLKQLEKISFPKGGEITTLDTLFASLSNIHGNLIIEPKIIGLEKEILNLIDRYNFWGQAIIWSFKHQSIRKFTELCGKRIKKAILVTFRPVLKENILKKALYCGADFVFPVIRNLDIDYFNQNGIGLIKGYSDENKAKKFLERGGIGIMTANIGMFRNLKGSLK